MKSFSKYLAEQRGGSGPLLPFVTQMAKRGLKVRNPIQDTVGPFSGKTPKAVKPKPGETISQAQQRKSRNKAIGAGASLAVGGTSALETERSIAGKDSPIQQRMQQLYPDIPSGRREAYQAISQAGRPPASMLSTTDVLSGLAGGAARVGTQLGGLAAGGGPGVAAAAPTALAVKKPTEDAVKEFLSQRELTRPFAGTRPNESERGIAAAGRELNYAGRVDQAIRDIMQPRYDATLPVVTKPESEDIITDLDDLFK